MARQGPVSSVHALQGQELRIIQQPALELNSTESVKPPVTAPRCPHHLGSCDCIQDALEWEETVLSGLKGN